MAGRPHDADEPHGTSPEPVDDGGHEGAPPPGAEPGRSDEPDAPVPAAPEGAADAATGDDAATEKDASAEDVDDEPDGADDAGGSAVSAGVPDGAPDHAPGGTTSDADVEARWREIVAQLGDLGAVPAPGEVPARPDQPRRRSTDVAPPEPGADAPGPGARTVRPPGPTTPRSWAPDPAVEEAEDHFQPPDPGPVLGGDPLLTMAWAAVVGVPLLMLVAVVVWRDLPAVVLQAAGVAFVAAVGLLLWRMPHRRDDDDGPGAVV